MGGDLTDFGSPDDPEYLVRQAQATGATVWAVAGNCDSPLIDERLAQLGVSLHGRGVVYQGLGLQGLSAMPPWRSSMYSFTEQELSGFLGAGHSSIAQAKTRIVLSHAPPHGVRDRTGLFRHVGSTALRDFIQETQPALVLCGHIHEARGVDSLGRTVVVNCGAAKNGYYAVADVTESGEVRTELRRE